MKIDIVIADSESEVEKVIECINQTAPAGKTGDEKIFVIPVEKAARARTNEKEHEAV